jgi:hypothetical protein
LESLGLRKSLNFGLNIKVPGFLLAPGNNIIDVRKKFKKNTTFPGYTNVKPRYSYWIQQKKSRTKHNNSWIYMAPGQWTQFLGVSQLILDTYCVYEIFWLLDKVPRYSKHIYRKKQKSSWKCKASGHTSRIQHNRKQ